MKSKRKKIIELIFIAIVASCVFELCITKILNIYSTSSIDRIVVIVGILIFIGLHMIIGIKKLYDFIIRYRYPIGAVCIIVFTLLQYSGSSNGALSYWVLEPEKDNTIWGIARGIHSDEYALETLLAISQKSNHFAYMNRQIRGIPTDVFSVVHPPVKDI